MSKNIGVDASLELLVYENVVLTYSIPLIGVSLHLTRVELDEPVSEHGTANIKQQRQE